MKKQKTKILKHIAPWKTNSLNKSFWKEVLLNRKIVDIVWGKDKIDGLILDNGELLLITTVCVEEGTIATLAVRDNIDE